MTGANAIRIHCLHRWLEKIERDGPDYTTVPMKNTEHARRIVEQRHADRVNRARRQIETMEAE